MGEALKPDLTLLQGEADALDRAKAKHPSSYQRDPSIVRSGPWHGPMTTVHNPLVDEREPWWVRWLDWLGMR